MSIPWGRNGLDAVVKSPARKKGGHVKLELGCLLAGHETIELKNRPPQLETESISSFIDRLCREYSYSKGTDRYFWTAIKELEEEGKLRKRRVGKRKIISLHGVNECGKESEQATTHKHKTTPEQLKALKEFLSAWELE